MSIVQPASGEPVEIVPDGARTGLTGAVALVRDDRLEVMRWLLPAGRSVPEHLAYGPATLQCVEGEVLLEMRGARRPLAAGRLVYLAPGERHALHAVRDAVLLVTMVLAPPPDGARRLPPAGVEPPMHGERTDAGGTGR